MTSISTILFYIRAALQDFDSENRLYSDEALEQNVSLTVLGLSFDPETGVENTDYAQDGDGNFIADLTSKQKVIVSLKTAIRILSGNPAEFSYKSPVISVSRKFSKTQIGLIDSLQEMLDAAEGGRFSIETDTDFNAVIQGFDRFLNDYYRAERAWSGR